MKISTNKIHPNSWNPFSMSPEQIDNLVQDIRMNGVEYPLTARKCSCDLIEGDHYEIVDGEQRFTAATDRRLDLAELECNVLELDDAEARMRTVNLNALKGDIIPERFQKLVKELETKFKLSRETIASGFYMKLDDLNVKLAPTQTSARAPVRMRLAKGTIYSVSARLHSRKQFEYVRGILARIMKELECDEATAMLEVFETYDKVGRGDA